MRSSRVPRSRVGGGFARPGDGPVNRRAGTEPCGARRSMPWCPQRAGHREPSRDRTVGATPDDSTSYPVRNRSPVSRQTPVSAQWARPSNAWSVPGGLRDGSSPRHARLGRSRPAPASRPDRGMPRSQSATVTFGRRAVLDHVQHLGRSAASACPGWARPRPIALAAASDRDRRRSARPNSIRPLLDSAVGAGRHPPACWRWRGCRGGARDGNAMPSPSCDEHEHHRHHRVGSAPVGFAFAVGPTGPNTAQAPQHQRDEDQNDDKDDNR